MFSIGHIVLYCSSKYCNISIYCTPTTYIILHIAYIHAFVHTHIHKHHTCIHTYVYMYVHVYIHMYMLYVYVHMKGMATYIHVCMHICIQRYSYLGSWDVYYLQTFQSVFWDIILDFVHMYMSYSLCCL